MTDITRDILRLFAEGYSRKEIASQLGKATATIEYYIAEFRKKNSLKSDIHLVHYVLQSGISANLYRDWPAETFKQVVDDAVLIPSRYHNKQTVALHLLQQIGQSFPIIHSKSAVQKAAERMGLKVLIRADNPQEKDKKKRRYRVWRTDGLPWRKVNQIITQRSQNT